MAPCKLLLRLRSIETARTPQGGPRGAANARPPHREHSNEIWNAEIHAASLAGLEEIIDDCLPWLIKRTMHKLAGMSSVASRPRGHAFAVVALIPFC